LALFVRGIFPIQWYPLVHSRGLSPIRNLGTLVVAVVPQPSANLSHQQTPLLEIVQVLLLAMSL